ncbi:MAG: prolyl oligopeptidase family serine peptidase [Verrucomicrobiales bacterium]|nr:prolyl oligopeptidase family serine peptidase [Verrucomicrobiales bacterium]
MKLTGVILLLALALPVLAEKPGTWPIERLQTEVPKHRVLDDSNPVHSILFEGEPIDGKQTEVFAFYASPKTLGKSDAAGPFPGIVLIHGGGGTAFSNWAEMWAGRGYAAISMDLAGMRPPPPVKNHHTHKRGERKKLETGGLDHSHVEKFQNIQTETRDDDWPFHAAAIVMRAHSLLDSFPETDPDRTAVTGISWGGYTTCLAASLDDRFQCAIPVYGCGFLHEGESVQKPQIDRLGEHRDAWIAAYDPGSHLAKCTVPTFWVNGTHDKHYVLDSYAKSYSLVKSPKTFRIKPLMGHSHPAGWAPKEIGIYVDSILKNGTPLPDVGELKTENGTVRARVKSETDITKVELHFTEDDGPRTNRKWKSLPGTYQKSVARVDGLPETANTWLLTITDERDAMVTTEVGSRD